ncbi:MAG: formate hydrogenlyase [Candidatus Accumulibacter sp.]|jgi:hydrogenase-4 component E|nr:formate hydrogenlyase [Accumulibacter sp.]
MTLPAGLSLSLGSQLINLCAAVMLLLGFAMLAQRRILSLINLFMMQGMTLFASTLIVASTTGQSDLYVSAGMTLAFKVVALPWILHRLIRKLSVKWDIETILNIPTTMLFGIALVVIAFNVAQPISQLSGTIMRATIGIALACILLSFLMMITRSKAVPQAIAFLSMENSLFFAATSATYGMPMVVEIGVLFDLMVGMVVFGVSFFQIRQQFDSLDIRKMERIKEE